MHKPLFIEWRSGSGIPPTNMVLQPGGFGLIAGSGLSARAAATS